MKFNIESYRGVGPLKFGMTRYEVEQAIGHVDRVFENDSGIFEIYNFKFDILAQVLISSDELIEIGFGAKAQNVTFSELNLFELSPDDVLLALYRIDPSAVSGYGSIVFPKLGLSFMGFQKNDEDDARTLTAFKKGQWDDLVPSMKALKL